MVALVVDGPALQGAEQMVDTIMPKRMTFMKNIDIHMRAEAHLPFLHQLHQNLGRSCTVNARAFKLGFVGFSEGES